jgi:hypothetical protein
MKNSVRSSYGYNGTVPCGRLCRGIIGKIPFLETENIWKPPEFKYDPVSDTYEYYHMGKFFGNPSWEEVKNLEKCSVWEKKGVEERLLNYIKTGKDDPRDWDDDMLVNADDSISRIIREGISDL